MKKSLLLAASLVVAFSAQSYGADIAKGKAKADTICASCHGKEGMSTNPMYPHLAGQGAKYMEKQIKDFKAGKRTNDNNLMKAMVTPLTDDDIANVSAFYESLKKPEVKNESLKKPEVKK